MTVMLPATAGVPLEAAEQGGFSFVNLFILLAVAAIVVPAYLRLRAKLSRDRRARWAREDEEYRAAVEARDRQQRDER
ncbi:MAG TPA: hypothetical protein P5181_08655 [Dermatophilaceae bacterium]|nr:hypothetical protein [Dermatophilaceae bacterium]